ncbi:S-layer protein [Candidatus Woesearchaeota archaeon]|nr:S-layer protein [Candidatus Woesearchaeota archaeon]
MRVRTAVKKMVALGTGLTMVGATMFGAMAAADLAMYPAPFVSAGTYDATVVLGSSAKTEDVIGAIDIATALQAANVVSTPIAGGTATVTVDNGAKFMTSSTKLRYGDNLSGVKATLTKTELPGLLANKQVTGTDGTTYDLRFEVVSPTKNYISFGKSVLDVTEPVLFYDWTTNDGNYTTRIKFPTAVNLSLLANKDIELFGKKFTVGTASEQSSTKLTLYASGTDVSVDKGTPTTIGTNTVEVVGINANLGATTEGAATLRVNGETQAVAKGNTYTLGTPQVRVYIKDVFVYDAQAGLGGARLFVGSEKIVLEGGNAVTKGTANTVVDGTSVVFTAGSASKVAQIDVAVTPSSFATEVKGSKIGGELADPVFGSFKWLFHSFSPALDDASRNDIVLTASNTDLNLKAPLTTGQFSANVLHGNDTPASGNETYLAYSSSKRIWTQSGTAIPKGDYFILNDGKDKSRFLKFSGISNTSTSQKITVEDVATGTSTEWSHTEGTTGSTMTYDGVQYSFTVTPSGTSDGSLLITNAATDGSAAGIANFLFAARGAKITLPSSSAGAVTQRVTVTEKTAYMEGTNPDDYGQINVTVTYSEGATGNDVALGTPTYDATAGAAWSTLVVKGDGASYPEQAVTPYGTFVETSGDTNSRTKLTLKYTGSQSEVNFFLAPTSAAAATTTVSGTSTDKVVKIPVGSAQLDSEVASTWKNSNTIVVGGPCVNSVAASLLGNPAVCTTGFTEGEAMIKLFEQSSGKVSLLVAGFSGLDTRRAARVLNDYKTHQASGALKGTSVVVKGTSLTATSVEAGK